jgi:hypothetical protein
MNITKLEVAIAKDNESFCGEQRSMTLTQLKDSLARESLAAQVVMQAKEDDEELQSLKEQLKEASAPYREALTKQKLKIEFIVKIMEEKNIPE